jgi:hypothetical protein
MSSIKLTMATSRTATVISQGTYPARKAVISATGKIIPPPLIVIAVWSTIGLVDYIILICDFEIDKFDSKKK